MFVIIYYLLVCSLGNSELHVINFVGTFLSKDPIFHDRMPHE